MRQNLRFAVRALLANKAFTAAALTTLALGIGATTAMFSVTYGVLLRPLPYPDPDRLVQLTERHPGGAPMMREPSLSNLTYYAWNGQSRTLGPIAAFDDGLVTVGLVEPTRMPAGWMSAAAFDVLRVSPAWGRFFTEEDAREGATPVVILSDGLWRDRFGANPAAINRTIFINYTAHVIVGVAPARFGFPDGEARLWAPMSVRSTTAAGGGVRVSTTNAIARLLPGVSAAQAAAEGTAIARAQPRPPMTDQIWGKGGAVEVQVRPIVEEMTAAVKPVLLLFLAGAGCLLLIACANVANLLLSRGATRERELAVMLALGASRWRVVSHLLMEGLVIAMLGGALGIALAVAIVRGLPALAPLDFPRLDEVRLDWTMAAFACAASLLAGLVAGVMPAMKSGRQDLLRGLRTAPGASGPRHTVRSRRLLLVVEASLAMMLLIVATLVGRSFVRLMRVNPGYDAGNVLAARVLLPGAALKPGEADRFVAALLERLRAVPAVQAAGGGWMAPFGGSTSATTFTIAAPGREAVTARSLVNVVTPGYAEALRLQLRAGRLLNAADLSSDRQSLVVNEEFARTFLGGVEPIGVNVGVILSRGVEAEIVGVVRNVLKDGLQTTPQPEVYVVAAHRYTVGGDIKLVVRTADNPVALAGTVRQLVRQLRSDAAMEHVMPLALQVSDSVRAERLTLVTLGTFAVLAMLLAAVGLYGVLSYSVSTRQREIGIRTALGATGRNVAALVIRDGMSVALIGLLVGLVAAAGVARVLQSVLAGFQPLDAVAFGFAPLVLAAVALAACLLPARRAAAVDPVVALRCE